MENTTQLLLKKAIILAPESSYHLKKKDILIQHGVIEKIADHIPEGKFKVLQAKNMYVSAGWVDMFADFCDPGYEHKEDLLSGKLAALKGGYTEVCLIPNTQPPVTGKSGVEWIKQKSDIVNLHPIGAISAKIEGKDLAEMYDMQQHGAVAFSDGTQSLQSAGLMLKALQYVKAFKGIIIQMPEEKSIAGHGLMHEGTISTALGMQSKPAIAESILIQRDLELLRYTQSRLHFTGISTAASVNLIRKAKKEGLDVSCSVTPYHLRFTHEDLQHYNSIFKVNPPLRTEADRKALLKGVEDRTIDCIASHHRPQDWDAKNKEFEYAANGMIGLQTVLSTLLQTSDKIAVERWIEMLSEAPRKLLGLAQPVIKIGASANLTIFNTHDNWTVNKQSLQGKSFNTPFMDQNVKGKILGVIHQNKITLHE